MADWEINGIKGYGEMPAIAGTFSGPLVILGGAPCIWDDLAQVTLDDVDYLAINFTGFFAHRNIRHWANRHPEDLPHYVALYQETYCPTESDNANYNFFAHLFRSHVYTHAPQDAEVNWQFVQEKGSSAMFAVQVGLALGYAPIWLAGVPLDNSGRFGSPPWITSFDYAGHYQEAWQDALPLLQGRVKSFSGWTRELLGMPE